MAASILASGQLGFSLCLLRHLRQISPSGVDEPIANLRSWSAPTLKTHKSTGMRINLTNRQPGHVHEHLLLIFGWVRVRDMVRKPFS